MSKGNGDIVNGKAEGRNIDQKFAVICYAAAVCISAVSSAIVSATVDVSSNLYIYLSYLLPQVGYIGVFAVMWYRYKKGFGGIVVKANVKGTDYLLAVPIAAGVLFFGLLPNFGMTKLFELVGIKAAVVVPEMNVWYDYVISGLLICVLPAIGEELVFRKAFCDGAESVADYKTILLCGLCFSLSHLNPVQTLHQFYLGCILALVYITTKNVTVTMLMHFINNALALYLERITGAEIWNNITVMIICFVLGAAAVAAGLMLLLRKGRRPDNKKTGKPETITVILIGVLALAWVITLALSFG